MQRIKQGLILQFYFGYLPTDANSIVRCSTISVQYRHHLQSAKTIDLNKQHCLYNRKFFSFIYM